ncbi:MAG: OsmC family protein [Candidatus Nitrosopolaris sp.]
MNGMHPFFSRSSSYTDRNGNRLGPMAYCVAGITSCFIATFASVAASQGVKLTKLIVNTECMINFAKTFDIANEPITEGINFDIAAESDIADKQKLQELVKMAEERCPAMYSMSHVIKVNAQIK